jgi:hypothetical protein
MQCEHILSLVLELNVSEMLPPNNVSNQIMAYTSANIFKMFSHRYSGSTAGVVGCAKTFHARV